MEEFGFYRLLSIVLTVFPLVVFVGIFFFMARKEKRNNADQELMSSGEKEIS